MKLKFALTCLMLLATLFANGQSSFLDWGFEFQAYPTGLVPGIRVEQGKGKNAFHYRGGFNWIRHGDFGKHEDERGFGIGSTLGYKRYFKDGAAGFFTGVKTDLWFNEIDWKDNIGQPDERKGTTKIIVLQPTVEFGYAFMLSPSVVISPNIAFGFEMNVHTNGEPTGEGAVFLIGFHIGKRRAFPK